MRAEELQVWLAGETREYSTYMWDWEKVVDIIQSTLKEGWTPVECAWQTVVLYPKGDG